MLGLLTDSDFGGGGTDSKGWVGAVQYGLAKQSYIQLTYFDAERKDSESLRESKAVHFKNLLDFPGRHRFGA